MPASLELLTAAGFSGRHASTVAFVSTSPSTYVRAWGAGLLLDDTHGRNPQQFLRGHDAEVVCLTVSPSGRLIASGQIGSAFEATRPAHVYLWDRATGQGTQLQGHTTRVVALSFSPDEALLVSADEESEMRVWDTSNGKLLGRSKNSITPFTCFLWGPPSNERLPHYSLFALSRTQIRAFHVEHNIPQLRYVLTHEFVAPPSLASVREYTAAVLEPGGRFMLAATTSGDLVVFEIASKVCKTSTRLPCNGLLSLAVHGETIYAGTGDGRILRLTGKGASWANNGEARIAGKVTSLSVRSDGQEILAGTSLGHIYVVDAISLSPQLICEGHTAAVKSVGFSPDASRICSAGEDSTIMLWDVRAMHALTRIRGSCPANRCALTEDGMVVSCWGDGAVRCHTDRGDPAFELPTAHKDRATSLSVTPLFILTGGADGTIRVWNRRTHQFMGQFGEHQKEVTGVLFDVSHPNWVHSCSADQSWVTFDMKTERRVGTHTTRDCILLGMGQRSSGEKEILTVASDGRIMLWDVVTAAPLKTLHDPDRKAVHSLSLSSSGRWCATAGVSGRVHVWDLTTNTILKTGEHHTAPVLDVAFSQDENHIVSGDVTGCICLWKFRD